MRPARRRRVGRAVALVGCLAVFCVSAAAAQAAPVKLVRSASFGREVDLSTGGDVCTVASGDECQPGKPGTGPGEFHNVNGVAVAPGGDVYVTDTLNARVQELTPGGEFVLMFGKGVNRTTGGDVCTQEEVEAEGVECQAGEAGEAAGALSSPHAVAVDPATGSVYVAEESQHRVDEYTAGGQFVLMFGWEVNRTRSEEAGTTPAERNLCTQEEVETEGVECQAGVFLGFGTSEPGAFVYPETMVVSPVNHLLYVGEEHRVQELNAAGGWEGEITLTGISSEQYARVSAITADPAGDLYLVYAAAARDEEALTDRTVREYTAGGESLGSFEVAPREAAAPILVIKALADRPSGLAIVEAENSGSGIDKQFGTLRDPATGRLITEFTTGTGSLQSAAISFDAAGAMFSVTGPGNSVVAYEPKPVAELVTLPLTGGEACTVGSEVETLVSLTCTLAGEANPYGVSETEAFFEWGLTEALGHATPGQMLCESSCPGAALPVAVAVEGLRPDQRLYYRLAGYDANVKAPESPLRGERLALSTPAVKAVIDGAPEVYGVKSSSAVMYARLDPENAASEYFFQYGPCEGGVLAACEGSPYAAQTVALKSDLYGELPAIIEARGLQPATLYHYRLVASNAGGVATGGEGTFTTAPAPKPNAVTGAVSAVGATSATVSGAVDPDGRAASYAFEVGVDEGVATSFGVVFSGSAGEGTVPVPVSLVLTGLQPGTTYAYRVLVESGYGRSVGATVTFTTAGLPAVISVPGAPALLAVPQCPRYCFPRQPKEAGGKQTRAQKLAKALRACHRRPRRRRGACVRRARRRYGRPRRHHSRRRGGAHGSHGARSGARTHHGNRGGRR